MIYKQIAGNNYEINDFKIFVKPEAQKKPPFWSGLRNE